MDGKTDNDPIASFIARYRREYDFYYEVARLVSEQCDALAVENGIRAIVTFRAKSPQRLESKLHQRNPERLYQTENEIRADIVDLSGVRVALYFPGDRAKIASLFRGAFVVDQEKQFPDKPKEPDR
jgi:ppGpp synthetase/RelA/SpoT-type nucleotidyltranferase